MYFTILPHTRNGPRRFHQSQHRVIMIINQISVISAQRMNEAEFSLILVWWPSDNKPPLRWRHNYHAGVSNHQPHGCLLNRLFKRRSKKTSKLRVTGLMCGEFTGTGEFPAQRASNEENASIWWRHHDTLLKWYEISIHASSDWSDTNDYLFTCNIDVYVRLGGVLTHCNIVMAMAAALTLIL